MVATTSNPLFRMTFTQTWSSISAGNAGKSMPQVGKMPEAFIALKQGQKAIAVEFSQFCEERLAIWENQGGGIQGEFAQGNVFKTLKRAAAHRTTHVSRQGMTTMLGNMERMANEKWQARKENQSIRDWRQAKREICQNMRA